MHLWSGRERSTGAGEGRGGSGLRFDTADEPAREEPVSQPAGEMTELSRRTAEPATEHAAPVSISEVHTHPGNGADPNEEWVAIRNVSEVSLDFSGWRLEDDKNHRYSFPNGFELPPDGKVTLYSGGGNDGRTKLYWGQDAPVLDQFGVLSVYHIDSLITRRPYPAPAHIPNSSPVVVGEIHVDLGPSDLLNDEYITFVNPSHESVNMGGWEVQNEEGLTYTFPSGFELQPSGVVRLRSGTGTQEGANVFWGSETEVRKDSDGIILLIDDSGRPIFQVAYYSPLPNIGKNGPRTHENATESASGSRGFKRL